MKKYISYLLPILLITGISILAFNRIINNNKIWENFYLNLDIPVISLYIIWIIFEMRVSLKDARQEKTSDYGTREIYAVSQALTIFSALWFKSIWKYPGINHLAGIIFFMAGICFRIWAVLTLGRYYSHVVRKIEEHKVITGGPYKYLRHPAYTGMLTAHLGITVFYFNIVTLLIFLLLLTTSIILRIKIEEKTLMTISGYREYSINRKRIIPFIW